MRSLFKILNLTKSGSHFICYHYWTWYFLNDVIFNLLQTISHEIGHNFGMFHDWITRHKAAGCDGQGIMSYGNPPSQWSTCSRADFIAHYQATKSTWCMDGMENIFLHCSLDQLSRIQEKGMLRKLNLIALNEFLMSLVLEIDAH